MQATIQAPAQDKRLEDFRFWLTYPPRGRQAKSESTIQAYLYTVGRFLEFLGGREPDVSNVREFVEHLAENNSSRSVGRHIYALRDYFAHLGQDLDLSPPSYPKRLPRWLNADEWGKVLSTVEAPLMREHAPDRVLRRALFRRAALMVYAGAGLRLSEGCGLRRTDLRDGYLTVLGKGGDEKTIPVEDAVVVSIEDWVLTHDSPWVFPGKNGSHLSPRTMQQVIQDILKEAGIENIHRAVHMLRHTAGADLRKRGADIRDIQQFLRHSSIQSTQIYTQMAASDLGQKLPRRFSVRQARMF